MAQVATGKQPEGDEPAAQNIPMIEAQGDVQRELPRSTPPHPFANADGNSAGVTLNIVGVDTDA